VPIEGVSLSAGNTLWIETTVRIEENRIGDDQNSALSILSPERN
jgi:hypothetical protein